MRKVFYLLAFATFSVLPVKAYNFSNPTKLEPLQPCTASNIRTEKFPEAEERFRVDACQSLDKVVAMLNSPTMSDSLRGRSRALWERFLTTDINLRPLKKDMDKRIVGMVEVYEANPRVIRMHLYLNEKKLADPTFNYAFVHELQHVEDYYNAWEKKAMLSSYDTEINAFRLTSLLAQEMEQNKKLAKDSLFWDEKWLALSETERNNIRDESIKKFLKKCGIYKSEDFDTRDVWDFSRIIRPDPPKSARLEKQKDKEKLSLKEDA